MTPLMRASLCLHPCVQHTTLFPTNVDVRLCVCGYCGDLTSSWDSQWRMFGGSGVSAFGECGVEDGQFASPREIAVAPDQSAVFVVDKGNNRVQVCQHALLDKHQLLAMTVSRVAHT